jgi:cyclic pyranopterin phosphate synthase
MNGVDFPVTKVLDGIDAAVEAGLGPVKINVVLKRGANDDGIVDMARWAREAGHTLRFIEYMDVGTTNGWRLDEVVPAQEVIDTIGAVWPLESAAPSYAGEVAERWRYADGLGEIGVIASVTRPFCGDCTRARISAEGKLYTCLFSAIGHDLRGPLRDGRDDAAMGELVAGIWGVRDDRYSERRAAATDHLPKIEMFALGG